MPHAQKESHKDPTLACFLNNVLPGALPNWSWAANEETGRSGAFIETSVPKPCSCTLTNGTIDKWVNNKKKICTKSILDSVLWLPYKAHKLLMPSAEGLRVDSGTWAMLCIWNPYAKTGFHTGVSASWRQPPTPTSDRLEIIGLCTTLTDDVVCYKDKEIGP